MQYGGASAPPTVLMPGGSQEEAALWRGRGYTVVRLDVEPRVEPDIVATMTNMGAIGPYDAVFCNNAVEHLYPHEVLPALAEFYRVLRTGGHAIVIVPDLEGVAPTEDIIPEIGLTGLHLYYGDAALIAAFPFMAHHCGFVEATLRSAMEKVGFSVTTQRLPCHQLMAIGTQ